MHNAIQYNTVQNTTTQYNAEIISQETRKHERDETSKKMNARGAPVLCLFRSLTASIAIDLLAYLLAQGCLTSTFVIADFAPMGYGCLQIIDMYHLLK